MYQLCFPAVQSASLKFMRLTERCNPMGGDYCHAREKREIEGGRERVILWHLACWCCAFFDLLVRDKFVIERGAKVACRLLLLIRLLHSHAPKIAAINALVPSRNNELASRRRERWKRIPPRYLRPDPTCSGVKEKVPPCHRITLHEREVKEDRGVRSEYEAHRRQNCSNF